MLENPSPNQTATQATPSTAANLDSSTAGATVSAAKRYTPPNQRNRSNNRRKSSSSTDQIDQLTNLNVNDIDKNQGASSRNVRMDPGDAGNSNLLHENQYSGFVALQGCSNSAASRLLNDRWNAAVQLYNSSTESPDKPVMYLGGTAAWNNFRLPHQIMTPPGSNSSMQLDFLAELNRAMLEADSSFRA